MLHLRGFSFNSEDIQQFVKKDGQFKDLVHIEKMIETLPNSNSTKILYFVMKMSKISVHFYNAVEHLVQVDTPVLRHSNKNVLKKLEYFDVLDEVKFLFNKFSKILTFLVQKRTRFPRIACYDSLKHRYHMWVRCSSEYAYQLSYFVH